MLYLIDTNGNYYESDRNTTGAAEVPQRPDFFHDWDGTGWVERTTEKETYNTAAILSSMTYTVQEYLDLTAKAKGYDSILSACSYAVVPGPFEAEGVAFANWRSAVWSACYSLLAEVEAGTKPIPTKEQLLAVLPVFTI